jgi:hypothetical protein
MTNNTELMPLILAGDGYQLTIADEAIVRKSELLANSASITAVADNDDSARAQFHTRQLAAMRIEVEKSRKLVKEPVNRIGKMIDAAAADFLGEITAEEGRIKQLVGHHAEEVLRVKPKKRPPSVPRSTLRGLPVRPLRMAGSPPCSLPSVPPPISWKPPTKSPLPRSPRACGSRGNSR